jgi:hypothetical protein
MNADALIFLLFIFGCILCLLALAQWLRDPASWQQPLPPPDLVLGTDAAPLITFEDANREEKP